jgi:L-iditol 2-dehydrogenase
MPQHASAARLHGLGDIRVAEEPVRVPRDGESLVRIEAIGLCGSDLHWYAEGGIGSDRLTEPVVPGHEFAGVVEGGPLDGRRVAVDPAVPCERCELCRAGHQNLCRNVIFAGHGTTDGGMQQYLAWPTDALHPLPDGMDSLTGALLEPLGVALHAIDLGHVHVGDEVAVVGCGPIGLLLIQVLRAAGARVALAVEPLAHRRAAAVPAGAALAVAPEQAGEAVADVAFDVAGSDEAIDVALHAVRPGARVVLVGIPSEDRTSFGASLARRKGLTLVLARRMNVVYPRAIRLVEQGLVDPMSLVSHRFALADTAKAFDTAVARSGLKVVVEPHA